MTQRCDAITYPDKSDGFNVAVSAGKVIDTTELLDDGSGWSLFSAQVVIMVINVAATKKTVFKRIFIADSLCNGNGSGFDDMPIIATRIPNGGIGLNIAMIISRSYFNLSTPFAQENDRQPPFAKGVTPKIFP